ncbi:glycosyltransferase family 4 protein [Psychroserpens sp.]|uniref:glycosyltransferase family 4 protein n=1 Tax=Psychroserpens sp. TaxID=2020870 RepID=UPI003C796F2A
MQNNSVFIDLHYLKNLKKGFGQYALYLAKHISKLDNEDLDITFYLPSKWKGKFGNNVNYKSYYDFHKTFNFIKEHTVWHNINYSGKILPKKTANTKLIYTIHDAIFAVLNERTADNEHRFVELQNIINKSDALVYISKFTQQSILDNFDVPKHVKQYVVYNGNPFEDLPQQEKKDTEPYLLSVGEFRSYKNQRTLIPMMQHLDPKLKLVLLGKHSVTQRDEFIELARTHGVEDRLTLIPFTSEEKKIELYANATALVHPSLAEGFGFPVIEAMSLGIPVIISNKTALPEVGGTVANYFEHYEPKYMAAMVKTTLDDFNGDQQRHIALLKQQAATFSWKHTAKQYVEIYRSLML